jgi:hypothetical protein
MYIRFYAELISILLKINYLPLIRQLADVIDFLPPFRWGKRRTGAQRSSTKSKSTQLIMHKSGQSNKIL